MHTSLGPGLLESAYEIALKYELEQLGLDVQHQVPMPFIYKDVKLEVGYRVDLIINDSVLLEIKSVESLVPVHFAQTLTYLSLSKLRLGLLMNFNVKLLKEGLHRMANNL